MKSVKGLMARESGFTLVEMTVVIAIIAVLAALALPAVTGVTTDTRTTTKAGDIKSVETGVTRYDSDTGLFASSVTPATEVEDEDADGVIKIMVIDTSDRFVDSGTSLGSSSTSIDALCSGSSDSAALNSCFAPIAFAGTLVPDYVKAAPEHPNELIFATGSATSVSGTGVADDDTDTADLTIGNCNVAGDTCEFYLLNTNTDLTAALKVWAIDDQNTVFAFKEDGQYGSS